MGLSVVVVDIVTNDGLELLVPRSCIEMLVKVGGLNQHCLFSEIWILSVKTLQISKVL